MDKIDEHLCALLSADARMSISALSGKLKIARSTVQGRLERLEQSGVIAGYTIRKGDALKRAEIEATVLVQLEAANQAITIKRLEIVPQITAAYSASGRFDLILRVQVASTRLLDDVLDKIAEIPGVKSTESLIKLSTKFERVPV